MSFEKKQMHEMTEKEKHSMLCQLSFLGRVPLERMGYPQEVIDEVAKFKHDARIRHAALEAAKANAKMPNQDNDEDDGQTTVHTAGPSNAASEPTNASSGDPAQSTMDAEARYQWLLKETGGKLPPELTEEQLAEINR